MNNVHILVQQGIVDIQTGDFDAATNRLSKALEVDPLHPDANHLSAVAIIHSQGDLNLARRFVDKAISQRPEEAVFYCTLGTLMWLQQDILTARDNFKRALEFNPDYLDAWFNLGNACLQLGGLEEDLLAYQRVLDSDPGHDAALNATGLVYQYLGQYSQASEYYQYAVQHNPINIEYYLNLANAYHLQGEGDEAELAIQNALALEPDNAMAYNNLGTYHYDNKNYGDATEAFEQALELEPKLTNAWFNLGLTHHYSKCYQEAVANFDAVISLLPDSIVPLLNKANALYKLNRMQEAETLFRRIIEVKPEHKTAHLNLGHTRRRLGDLQSAVGHYNKAIALQPDMPEAHFSKSLVLLKDGQFVEGWRHYEWRFQCDSNRSPRLLSLKTPEWKGESLSGKSILVIGEQGLGDIVHFARYLPRLKQGGATVSLVCAMSLKKLIEPMACVDNLIDRNGPWNITEDFYVYLLSLPHVFNSTLDNLPGNCPYFHVEQNNIKRWNDRLNASQFNIGITWSGNPDQSENDDRSIPLEMLKPLSKLTSVSLFSLQKFHGVEQLVEIDWSERITDFTDEFEDYYDTASFMKALDLVITIDTSVAHVAGALNVPVWTMLWYAHCWRYLQHRTDSPWYPSMRLFRQSQIGQWQSVVDEMCQALEYEVRQG